MILHTNKSCVCYRMVRSGTLTWREWGQGAVSLTSRKLPKIFSRKYTTPEITFMVRISIWKFVRVPKAWLWAHVQSFSLKFSYEVRFLQYINFKRIFWRARETLVKQPRQATSHYLSQCWPRCLSPHSVTKPQSVELTETNFLTHWGLVTPYGDIDLGQHWLR